MTTVGRFYLLGRGERIVSSQQAPTQAQTQAQAAADAAEAENGRDGTETEATSDAHPGEAVAVEAGVGR